MPRLAARSPSSRKSSAARSMPPTQSGDTFEHIISRSQPSSAITSNLRSARAKTRSRLSPVMPSKSRNGWKAMISSPASSQRWRTSVGVPLNDSRSFSKISTPLNPAAAIAASFSSRLPLSETVAIDIFTGLLPKLGLQRRHIAPARFDSNTNPAWNGIPSPCPNGMPGGSRHTGPTRNAAGRPPGSLPTRRAAACSATM